MIGCGDSDIVTFNLAFPSGCLWPWLNLENAANDAAFLAARSPIDRHSLRAGDKRHHGGYFFGAFKAFEERGGTYLLKELLFHFGFRNVLLFRHARDAIARNF